MSYSPLASVYAGQSVTVGLTPLGQGTPVAGGLQYCGVIDASSVGYSNSSITLCAVINGATQSTSVAFPQPSTGYAVPVGGSITIQAAVSQFGSSTPVSLTQSVSCPGVSNCTAGATLVSSSNGNLTIRLNAGNVPGGLNYTQKIVINNEEMDIPIHCDPGGGVVEPTIIPASLYQSGSYSVSLATDNDGSTSTANYTMSCGTYSPCSFGSMGTCVAQGAGSHVTLFQRAYGAAGATSFGFSLSATADDQATAGFYQIACSYLGAAPIAGALAVYDATPVITSVSPGTVAACDTSLNNCPSITITGHNFGNNPTVTVGTLPGQTFANTSISGQQSVTGTFQIPASAAGSTLPVTVTATGESANGFLQNPQNNGASHPGSGMASVNVAATPLITVYLLHGIGQSSFDMQDLYQTLTSITTPSGLNFTRYNVDAGFSFSECAKNQACTVSQFGDGCGIDAGARSLARYILASNPPGDIVLIGYSMGGLIARQLIAMSYLSTGLPATISASGVSGINSSHIVGLITLGTPHLGYPYDPIDESVNCPFLDRDMAGGWGPLSTPIMELGSQTPSTFSAGLVANWNTTSFSGYWLAAAGTSCSNPFRNFPPKFSTTKGCVSSTGSYTTQAYSDGVVCRDSAVYQQFSQFPGFALPPSPGTNTWEDPAHNYVHTTALGGLGSGFLFCTNDPTQVFQLFDPQAPPSGLLIKKIVETLNGH